MSDKKISVGVTDVVFAILAIFFTVGILTFFAPCGPKDDGSWMACHWAGRAVAGISAVITLISLIHLFVPGKIKIGLDLAAVPIALLAAILPGNLINLCMMQTMKCHTLTHPATIVLSVLIIVAVVIDILIQRKKN